MQRTLEEIRETLESASKSMRGMAADPRMPPDAKKLVLSQALKLDVATFRLRNLNTVPLRADT